MLFNLFLGYLMKLNLIKDNTEDVQRQMEELFCCYSHGSTGCFDKLQKHKFHCKNEECVGFEETGSGTMFLFLPNVPSRKWVSLARGGRRRGKERYCRSV